MGGIWSKNSADSSSWNHYSYPHYLPPSPSSQQSQCRMPQHHRQTTHQQQRNFDMKYSNIADNYCSLDEVEFNSILTSEDPMILVLPQVTAALSQAGLESSNLIIGIDFTKSNEWTGSRSFNRRSLHRIGDTQNPYEQAISIIGRTLSAFDEDNLIPCFGFGDASTHDQHVFSFYENERYCNGFEEVLMRYREIAPNLCLAGPTSFAPIIDMAVTIVEQSGGQYHVLLLIADGQVTRSNDKHLGRFSPQEQKTIDAIVRASEYPLSIVLVGVGDGPWDMMKEFDDNIPARAYDNFQFVNFTEIMSKNVNMFQKEKEFALSALMEIPSQYKATLELGILGRESGGASQRIPLPPPLRGAVSYTSQDRNYPFASIKPTAPSPSDFAYDNWLCPICAANSKDMAFGCGHQTCCDCGSSLEFCPICRCLIRIRIRLY